MLAHSQTCALGNSRDGIGDIIGFEFPFTEPFLQPEEPLAPQELLHFSNADFSVETEEPFTAPLPTLSIADSDSASDTNFEYPFTASLLEPQWESDQPESDQRESDQWRPALPTDAPASAPALSSICSPALITAATEVALQPELSRQAPSQKEPVQAEALQLERLPTQTISSTTQKALREQALSWKDVGHHPSQPQPSKQQNLEDGFKHDFAALRDRYVIDKVLAVGGTGIVYKARAASTANSTGMTVAIKTLRPELRTNADAIQRLKREFFYTTALRHPNIVPHFGLEQAAGTWFITMALLGGRSLASLLNDSKAKHPSIKESLLILKGCSAALSYAHSHGIVHCDLKPSNIWITDAGQVLLIDFGAAQAYLPNRPNSGQDHTSAIERPLPRLATPAYASPQVLAGQAAEPRDDIYSLACIAYELLGARLPFDHSNVVEAITTGAVQGAIDVQHPEQTARVQALQRDIETSLDQAMAARPVLAVKPVAAMPIASQQMPQAVLPQPVLEPPPQTSIELPSTGTQKLVPCATDLAASTVHNPWLLSARPLVSIQGNASIRRPVHHQLKTLPPWHLLRHRLASKQAAVESPLKRRKTAAIGIVLALASLALFYRWPDSPSTSNNPVAEIGIQNASAARASLPGQRQMPIMVAGIATPRDAPSLSQIPTAWQAFTVNREWNPHWRVGVDLLPGTAVNAVASPTIKKAAIAPSARIALEQQNVTVSDKAVVAVLLLQRSGSRRDPATVRWRTVAGSAKPGADYQDESSGIARFADNQSTRALYVQLKQNGNALGNRSFAVELSKPSANAALGKNNRAVITIQASN